MSDSQLNKITSDIIGAIEVHRQLGPGLLKAVYRNCLSREFGIRNIRFEKEKPLPVEYKGLKLECGYRLDFLVEGCVVIEAKAVEAITPIFEAQLLTYMRLGNYRLGLLINFNVLILKEGIRRKILGYG